jgi:AcrR family transcriptional regulator
MKSRQTKAEQSEATLKKFMQVGREMFTERGYANTFTGDVVERMGITRGALYHHFGNKEGLFAAVLADVQAEVGERVEAAASAVHDPWDQLVAGCHAFLEAALDRHVQQIMLIDAPAVIGWHEWRRQDAENAMSLLGESLGELMAGGRMIPLPLEALTHLLSGAMNEAALWIAGADEPERALADAKTALDGVLTRLRL